MHKLNCKRVSRCAGMECRSAVIGQSGPHDPAARHQDTTSAVRAQAAGPQARGVRTQVEHWPPAAGLRWKWQQGNCLCGGTQKVWFIYWDMKIVEGCIALKAFLWCLQLLVWNHSSVLPMQQYTEHLAAVKAIAWSPHQHGLLASGGGTADRCIRFWNTLTAQPLQCIDTGSQVCNLAWSKHTNELVCVF